LGVAGFSCFSSRRGEETDEAELRIMKVQGGASSFFGAHQLRFSASVFTPNHLSSGQRAASHGVLVFVDQASI
jgi:hypothetical protein